LNVITKTVPAGEVRFGDRLVGDGDLLVMRTRPFVHRPTGSRMVTLKDGAGREITLPTITPMRIQRRITVDDQDGRDNDDILHRIMYRSNGWK
jgi:hypothetical protein